MTPSNPNDTNQVSKNFNGSSLINSPTACWSVTGSFVNTANSNLTNTSTGASSIGTPMTSSPGATGTVRAQQSTPFMVIGYNSSDKTTHTEVIMAQDKTDARYQFLKMVNLKSKYYDMIFIIDEYFNDR